MTIGDLRGIIAGGGAKMPLRSHEDVMVVGLTRRRGVIGVMPDESHGTGTLEGVSSRMQRDEFAGAIHRDG